MISYHGVGLSVAPEINDYDLSLDGKNEEEVEFFSFSDVVCTIGTHNYLQLLIIYCPSITG